MITAEEIHRAFKEQSCNPATEGQKSALKKAGFELNAPEIYSSLFPLHKIIHLNKILLLCEKYNLIFTETRNFSGGIPQKNLMELEVFMDTFDYVHLIEYEKDYLFTPWRNKEAQKHAFIKKRDKHTVKHDEEYPIFQWYIVAPKDMVVTQQVFDKTFYVPDPIIIGMINPEYGCGGLSWGKVKWGVIVTAWGDEAKDENVFNERLN